MDTVTLDIGWAVPFIVGLLAFIGFTVVLSLLYVWWNDLWGGHE